MKLSFHLLLSAFLLVTLFSCKKDEPPSLSDFQIVLPDTTNILWGNARLSIDPLVNTGISKVEFYLNGTLIGDDNTVPYELNYNTSQQADGDYVLKSMIYDGSGKSMVAEVLVAIANSLLHLKVSNDYLAPTESGTILLTDEAGSLIHKEDFKNGDNLSVDVSFPKALYNLTVLIFNSSEKYGFANTYTRVPRGHTEDLVFTYSPPGEANVNFTNIPQHTFYQVLTSQLGQKSGTSLGISQTIPVDRFPANLLFVLSGTQGKSYKFSNNFQSSAARNVSLGDMVLSITEEKKITFPTNSPKIATISGYTSPGESYFLKQYNTNNVFISFDAPTNIFQGFKLDYEILRSVKYTSGGHIAGELPSSIPNFDLSFSLGNHLYNDFRGTASADYDFSRSDFEYDQANYYFYHSVFSPAGVVGYKTSSLLSLLSPLGISSNKVSYLGTILYDFDEDSDYGMFLKGQPLSQNYRYNFYYPPATSGGRVTFGSYKDIFTSPAMPGPVKARLLSKLL